MTYSKKILLAEDSAVVAAMLSKRLKDEGYEVVRAADGIQASQMTYSERPDLILLDIYMPRMNGYQVCRLIKHDPAISHIPIIIVSGSENTSTSFWSHHTGANAFLRKSSDPAQLLATAARLLEQAPARPAANPQEDGPQVPGPEEILSRLSALMDAELYDSTVQRIQSETILERLCDGILILDQQGNITGANHALCRWLGRTQDELRGQSSLQALGEEVGMAATELMAAAIAGEPVEERDAELFSAEGKGIPVSIHVEALTDHLGQKIGGVCLFQDITRRKQVEALNQLKNDLTSMIVHDLRTPLTSLLTGLQTVELLGELNADQTEFLGLSIEGGQILLGMINDLLDIAKMEDGSLRLERQPITPPDLVERATRQVESLAAAKSIKLLIDIQPELPAVCGDEDKLCRTLVNLLSNAIKFTPESGSVTTAICKQPGDEVLFSVKDTGEGIPAEAFDRIFEKFGQVESRTGGRKNSTGLGLTFCKMVAEGHGGRIWVDSILGKGSTFSILIPIDHP